MNGHTLALLVCVFVAVAVGCPRSDAPEVVAQVAPVKRIKRLPLVKQWKLYDYDNRCVGMKGRDILNGVWYKPVDGWPDGKTTWRMGDTVGIPHVREVETEVGCE